MNMSIAKLLRDEVYYKFKIQMLIHFQIQINCSQQLQLYNQLDSQLYVKFMTQLDRQIWEANYE